jgi:hypothetical protein
MECLDSHPICGGTADRLKPLPSLLRVAASSKRYLLIHWSRRYKPKDFLFASERRNRLVTNPLMPEPVGTIRN